jgi:hypothetical protein
MNIVIDRFAQVLASPPEVVLPIQSIGAKVPQGSSELPMISLWLQVDDEKGLGYSRFIREGNSIVKSTDLIQVAVSHEAFLPGLRVLAISPLPLKKNPNAVSTAFSSKDVQIRNITDPNHPISYQLVEHPAQKEEFRLDVPAGQIVFGQAQKEGDQLEVVHYTVTWRDEIMGERYNGLLSAELWTKDFNEADRLSRKLHQKLRVNTELLRQKGYLRLSPASASVIERTLHSPGVGSPFPVTRQKLEYRYSFEAQEGGEISSGGVIKRIDVDIDDALKEIFSVPGVSHP